MPQSLSSILVHLVYSTKNRQPFMSAEIEPELQAYQATIFREMDCPSLAINGTSDHIHALFRLSRRVAVSDVVEEVKRRSSKWIKTKGTGFTRFQWQAGYGAFSIGESGVEALRRYIGRQKEYHRKASFQQELRVLLARYKVEYDEKYLWDRNHFAPVGAFALLLRFQGRCPWRSHCAPLGLKT